MIHANLQSIATVFTGIAFFCHFAGAPAVLAQVAPAQGARPTDYEAAWPGISDWFAGYRLEAERSGAPALLPPPVTVQANPFDEDLTASSIGTSDYLSETDDVFEDTPYDPDLFEGFENRVEDDLAQDEIAEPGIFPPDQSPVAAAPPAADVGPTTAHVWSYDYDDGFLTYVDLNRDGTYDAAYQFFDVDVDGLHDAYTAHFDDNADGRFDRREHHILNSAAAGTPPPTRNLSLVYSVDRRATGTVLQVQEIDLPDAPHRVAELVLNRPGRERVLVDLGPAPALGALRLQPEDALTAEGPTVEVGRYLMVMARRIGGDGWSMRLERSRQNVSARVVATREITVRGGPHRMAVVDSTDGRRLVDFGPTATLAALDLEPGTLLTVYGAPARIDVDDVLIATRVQQAGRMIPIDRSLDRPGPAPTAHTTARVPQPPPLESSPDSSPTGDDAASGRATPTGDEQRRVISISGFVTSLRTPVVSSRPVQIVELQTASGDRATVDLGPVDDFPVTLRKGDRVTIEGLPAEDASGELIILADTIALRGQTWSIPDRNIAGSENRIAGEVVSVSVSNVRGTPHQLAQVRTADGRRVTVDLGNLDQLPQPVHKHDLLTAQGMLVTMRGQRVLIAEQYRRQPQSNSSVWR